MSDFDKLMSLYLLASSLKRYSDNRHYLATLLHKECSEQLKGHEKLVKYYFKKRHNKKLPLSAMKLRIENVRKYRKLLVKIFLLDC